MTQRVGIGASVAQLTGMCAGVGESEHRVGLVKELRDFLLVVVEDRDTEQRCQVRRDRQVQHHVHRMDAALAAYFSHRALL